MGGRGDRAASCRDDGQSQGLLPLDDPQPSGAERASAHLAGVVPQRLAEDLGRDVLLISAVTGQGLAKVVGEVSRMIADLKRQEAEEAARRQPMEFAREASIRTSDFKTTAVASITPPEGE